MRLSSQPNGLVGRPAGKGKGKGEDEDEGEGDVSVRAVYLFVRLVPETPSCLFILRVPVLARVQAQSSEKPNTRTIPIVYFAAQAFAGRCVRLSKCSQDPLVGWVDVRL